MLWFYLALAAPALWSISNHFDKYLLGRYFKHGAAGALLIFSCAIAIVYAPIVLAFHPHVFAIQPSHAMLMVLNGFVYIVALIPYMYAMQEDEASIVAPLFQMIPVFGYVFGILFLREYLTAHQLLASFVILIGAVFLSFDLAGKVPQLKRRMFALMCLSSVLIALNNGLFKFIAIDADFWTTSFWEYIGVAACGVVLLVFVPTYRAQFKSVLRENTLATISLNAFNEVINIIAKLLLSFATLLAPLALVLVVSGTQPLFVFAYGVFLTLFFPKWGSENITKRHLAHKCIAITVVCVGAYLLQSGA